MPGCGSPFDLLGWTRLLALDGELAKAEPGTMRYRLLHVGARIVHGQRRRHLKIPTTWPWADQLVAAFTRIVKHADQVGVGPWLPVKRGPNKPRVRLPVLRPPKGNGRADRLQVRSLVLRVLHRGICPRKHQRLMPVVAANEVRRRPVPPPNLDDH